MLRFSPRVLCPLAPLLLGCFMLPSSAAAGDQMPWVDDLATAQRIAAEKNQLVLLHFTADWCSPCQRLKKKVFSQRSFAHAVGEQFVPVRVDVGVHPQIVKHYRVQAWPTDVIIDPNGNELHRMVSPQDDREFLSTLRQVAWRHQAYPGQQVAQSSLPSTDALRPKSSITAPMAKYIKSKFGRQTPEQQMAIPRQFQNNAMQQLTQTNAVAPNAPMAPNAAPYASSAGGQVNPSGFVANTHYQQPAIQRPQIQQAQFQQTATAPAGAQRAQFMQLQPPQGANNGVTPPQPMMTPQRQAPSGLAPVESTPYSPQARMVAGGGMSPNVMAQQMTNPTYVQNPLATSQMQMPPANQAVSQATPPAIPTSSMAGVDTHVHRAKPQPNNDPGEPQTVYNEFVTAGNPSQPSSAKEEPTPAAKPIAVSTLAPNQRPAPTDTTATPENNVTEGPNFTGAPQLTDPSMPLETANTTNAQINSEFESTIRQPPVVGMEPAEPPTTASVPTAPSAAQRPTPAVPAPGSERPNVVASPEPTSAPMFALDGYCPVSLYDQNDWVKGDQRWGARHRGSIYLFRNAASQQRFLAAPDRYSPILAGYDPVAFVDQQQYISGSRKHGIRFQDRVVLFSSEESLNKFSINPDRYAHSVRQAMQQSTQRR